MKKQKELRNIVSGGCILLIALLGIAIIISMGFPMFFDKCLIGKAKISNITCENWTGFMGSYAGGIIGGLLGSIATILGVYLTIKQQQLQVREERRLAVRPALYFFLLKEDEKDDLNSWSEETFNIANTDNTKTEKCVLRIRTENLGPGQIIKIMLNIPELDSGESATGAEYSLTKCGESRYWKYGFDVTYDREQKSFDIPLTLNFYYKDVFGNVYIQTVHAVLQKSYVEEDGKEVDAPITVDLVGEVTEPQIAKKKPGFMKGWQN